MTAYSAIKKLENDINFLILLRRGVIPLSILDKKVYYEFYINELKTVNKTQAIANTAEEYKVSERTIIRAVDFMN